MQCGGFTGNVLGGFSGTVLGLCNVGMKLWGGSFDFSR